LTAIGTLAIKFHPVVRDFKTVALSNVVLKCFNVFILKFNDLSTPETNQMIMMAPSRSGFISGLSIGKFSLDCKARTGEELQGSINGRITNFRIDLHDLGIDLGEVLMAVRVKKDVEDLLPLFGRLQPLSRNPSLKQIGFHKTSHLLKLKSNFILK
jgi:hypothetical protein